MKTRRLPGPSWAPDGRNVRFLQILITMWPRKGLGTRPPRAGAGAGASPWRFRLSNGSLTGLVSLPRVTTFVGAGKCRESSWFARMANYALQESEGRRRARIGDRYSGPTLSRLVVPQATRLETRLPARCLALLTFALAPSDTMVCWKYPQVWWTRPDRVVHEGGTYT